MDGDEFQGLSGCRIRTFSNVSQQSQPSSKQNFPLLASDSGLYTCSSNTSDCSLQLESDTDSCHQTNKITGLKDKRLQLALQDVRKLRSELERLTKSEQWYKQELRQQKSIRLDDLERIYSQERQFMQENQRLQKECVRLYEKCNELERELEQQNQKSLENTMQHLNDDDKLVENLFEFEKEQQLALAKDQQQLISLLRKQKRSLLEDIRSLTVEKDDKVMELQRLLADLEFDNQLITKKCSQYAKERLNLENDLKQSDRKLDTVLQENMNLQKSIVDLKEQLEIQQQLLQLKESEVEDIQLHYTNKIQQEENMDQVHKLSMKYQEEINAKTLEIINLKERLQEMHDEMEDMQNLQEQNELQQRQIDQLNFSIDKYRLELYELKSSDEQKNKQLKELYTTIDQLIKDKEIVHKTTVEQQNNFLRLKQTLKATQEQYEQLQELYKSTQYQLELLEIEQGKVKFQSDSDRQEIEHLRSKLTEYLQQTTDLSNKIQYLENQLATVLKENTTLKQCSEKVKNCLQNTKNNSKNEKFIKKLQPTALETEIEQSEVLCLGASNKNYDDQDFLELQQQCENLQAKLDFIKDNQLHMDNYKVLHDSMKNSTLLQIEDEKLSMDSVDSTATENLIDEIDFLNISLQGEKLQKNLDKLNDFLKEKQQILSNINTIQNSNEGIEKLVEENKILKEKLCATEAEALTLQIKQDISQESEKYIQTEDTLKIQKEKVAYLQDRLLTNDSILYKLERKLKTLEELDENLEVLRQDNTKLKEQLELEQASKSELNEKLVQQTEKLKNLRQSLEEMKMSQSTTKDQATLCLLVKSSNDENGEIKKLKEHILELQEQQRRFLQEEASKKEQRLQFLHQMMDLQNNKMHNLQKHQKDWEDVLTSLSNAQALEEKTRQEFELKRMELEELNKVFAEQNEELRKFEEFTALLEIKRQKEKEEMKLTFQQEMTVMKQHLQDCQVEIEKQKLVNQQLGQQNEKFQQDINEDDSTEVGAYKNEIRELKSRVNKITEEKEDLLENLKEIKSQTKNLKCNKREAILMADFNLVTTSENNSVANREVLNQQISEDHLRILTKVLEAEYQRKMIRYDEHIHSLLSNLKSLKRSLKANEEKTAFLSEEQLKAKKELKDLQKTKISLEEMRLKYEQSQSIIKELKNSLAFERKKFELSDFGKSSQITTYEVSNLIDDYKKLIQQSAIASKRPSTSAILDLIQRSNQYVPNLEKLENNVEGLRFELQNFLNSYSHKIPATSLITTASLSVPPSLMDELRAASEGF